jgi:hypothetical protein
MKMLRADWLTEMDQLSDDRTHVVTRSTANMFRRGANVQHAELLRRMIVFIGD